MAKFCLLSHIKCDRKIVVNGSANKNCIFILFTEVDFFC